ncbi:MAG: ClpP family protease [Oscillospiraceae bacterium]|nr:ClpP family protease [Oscillospiraceae bacterium]
MNLTPNIIKETSRGIDCIRLEDELLKSREIFLTETVNAETMDGLLKQLMYLNKEAPEEEITLYINSPGGEVRSGIAVYDYMKMMQAPIRTVCIGTAASMGAILFLAGDRREMLPHSQLMIHDPAPGGGSMQGMKPAQMEEHLKSLKKVQKVLCEIISETTGRSLEEVQNITQNDSYFDAEEAIEFGLATSIIKNIY